MKKGIIFDMDGTLWDSAAEVAKAWNEAMRQTGYERKPLTEADIKSVMGLTMVDLVNVLYPGIDQLKLRDFLDLSFKLENDYLREHGGMLYPKIRETMERLKRTYHLYIVSNCQTGYIEAFLDHYQFRDLIEDFVCYGDNDQPKGVNIRLICERNGLDDAVYVGDIQGDYDESMKAGVRFIHAAYGFGTIRQEVLKIRKFEELVEVADKAFEG